jgi:hypothetical protein
MSEKPTIEDYELRTLLPKYFMYLGSLAATLYAKEENYYREEYKEIVNDLEEKIEERGGILYDHNNFTFKS